MEQLTISELILIFIALCLFVWILYYFLFLKPEHKRTNRDRYVEKENDI